MSLLSQVSSPPPRPRRVLLYGTHGIGKSTWAAAAPGAVFLPTEDGCRDIPAVNAFPLLTSYEELTQAIYELATERHSFRSLVIDSLDWAEKLVKDYVIRKNGVKSIEDIGYGKGYVQVAEWWLKMLGLLDQCNKSMNIICIAHSQIERYNNPDTDPYDRYSPSLDKRTSPMVQEWADEVFFASYKVYTTSTDDGPKKTRTRGIGGDNRIVYTVERPSHYAKNRLRLPEELPLDFAAYWDYVVKGGGNNLTPLEAEAAEVFKV